jgi:hypothetical protein
MLNHISFSSNTTFERCKFKFAHTYSKEIRPESAPSAAQRIGIAGHLALKALYLKHPLQVALDWAYESFNPHSTEELQQFDLFSVAIKQYKNSLHTDAWKVLYVEHEVKIGRYMGILDLVIKIPTDQIFIVDHKFQKSLNASDLDHNPQISFYLMLATLLSLEVEGLIYNMIDSSAGVVKRKIVYRTPTFLKVFKHELDLRIAEMDAFNPQTATRNFTRDCRWDCGLYKFCMEGMNETTNQSV